MNSNRSMTSFMDLMAILLAGMMLIACLMGVAAVQESFHAVSLPEQQRMSASTGLGKRDQVVTIDLEGALLLEARQGKASQAFSDLKDLETFLKTTQPDTLYVRADRRVAFGRVSDVMQLAKQLQIGAGIALNSTNGSQR